MTEQNCLLHLAVVDSDEDEARKLIIGDANLAELNEDDWSPLHLCAQTNNDRIARWLINAGAKVNLKNSKGVTPLHSSAWTNSVNVGQLLLKNGANPNLKDDSSWTPLMLAAWNNHYKIIDLFLQNGASVNARSKTGSTSLHFAAYNNAALAVDALLENKASVNITNDEGFTAYDLAIRKKNAECIIKLEVRTAIDARKTKASAKVSNAPIVVNTEDYFHTNIGVPAGDTVVLQQLDEEVSSAAVAKKDTSQQNPKAPQKKIEVPSTKVSVAVEEKPKTFQPSVTSTTTITDDIVTKDSFFLDSPEVDMPFLTELTKEQSRLSSDGYTSEVLFPEQLINISLNGDKMRRKSEVIIANLLFSFDIHYVYERKLCGTVAVGINYPAYSIFTKDDRIIIWEHISGLNNPEKRKQFNQLKRWYKLNGFIENENFFTTQDTINGGVDSPSILAVVEKIQERLEQAETTEVRTET